METEQKAIGYNNGRSEGISNKRNTSASSSSSKIILLLRSLAIIASLVAAIVMALDKETKTVNVTIAPMLPPLPVPVTAKTSYSSAFMYFVVVNAIVCSYSALSLVLSIIANKAKNGTNILALSMSAADVIVVALLFSGLGAAAAIGVVGEKGISHVGWNKVCNVYTKFCAHVMVSVAVSFVACLAYVFLVLVSFLSLHKKLSTVDV